MNHQTYNEILKSKNKIFYISWCIYCEDDLDNKNPDAPKIRHNTQAGVLGHKIYCCRRYGNGSKKLRKAFRRLIRLTKKLCPEILRKVNQDYIEAYNEINSLV